MECGHTLLPPLRLSTDDQRASTSLPSHIIHPRRSYLRSNRQTDREQHSSSSSSSWPLSCRRRRCRSSSHIKAVKNNPFMRRRGGGGSCAPFRAHSPTSCYSHTCCSLAKRRRESEKGENMQQRTFMAPNFGRRGGARENYGEKLALSSPLFYPLLSSSPNDDWQAVRARQLPARSA